MNARTIEERARSLTEHLDPALARYLGGLIEADSHALTCQELQSRAQRAEDVVAEMRRQLDPLARALDRAREEMAELKRSAGLCPTDPLPRSARLVWHSDQAEVSR